MVYTRTLIHSPLPQNICDLISDESQSCVGRLCEFRREVPEEQPVAPCSLFFFFFPEGTAVRNKKQK